MRIFKTLSLLLAALIGLTQFSIAWADEADGEHYRNILIGEQASGLGGAFIAVADDPSGIIYNPAGIVFGMENYFSLSANAYMQNSRTYKNVVNGQDYTYQSSGLVPTFFGLTQNIGKGKWGFAIAVPDQDNYNQDDVLANLSSTNGAVNTLRRRYYKVNQTYLIGPAYAAEVQKDFTMGLSLLAIYHTYMVIDNQELLYNGGETVSGLQTIDQQTYGLYPKIGAQYMPAPKVSIGATLAKKLTLQSNRHKKSSLVDTAAGTNPTDTDTRDKPTLVSPIEIGLGVAYFPSKRTLYTGDFIYYTADNSNTDYKVQPTWNISLGTEQYLTEKTLWRLGAYTNNSNTPAVQAGGTNQVDHVDLYGLSAAISMRNPGSSVTMGATYSMGSGQGQALGSPSTTVNTLNESRLAFYLIGSYQL